MDAALNLLYARRRRESNAAAAELAERTAYHGTSKTNLRAIRSVGLLPKVGDNTKDAEGHEVEAKVCVALSPKKAREYAGPDGVVLKVDLDHPELDGASPSADRHEKGSLTINQRIPPTAITVQRVEGRGLRLARLSEAYARDPQPSRHLSGLTETTAHELATGRGFREQHRVDGQFGSVIRYYHQNGDNLIVTELPENLRERGAPWDTKWEYHTVDGVKSTGFDVRSLQRHLR